MKTIKRYRLNKMKLLRLIVFLFFFILLIISFKNIIKWTIDNNTTYEFKKDNTGKLILPISEYDFTYKIDNNTLYIDFKSDKSTDTTYIIKIKKDKLILSNDNGIFNLNRLK